jgi:hypothetical protein
MPVHNSQIGQGWRNSVRPMPQCTSVDKSLFQHHNSHNMSKIPTKHASQAQKNCAILDDSTYASIAAAQTSKSARLFYCIVTDFISQGGDAFGCCGAYGVSKKHL